MSNYTYADLFDKSASKKEITIETEDKSVKITNSEIHFEQFELKEILCDDDYLTFGQCNASQLKFKISNVFTSMIGKQINVSAVINGHTDTPFIFGKYRVVSDKPTDDKRYRNVTAYDVIYDIGESEVSSWYNGLKFPLTLKQFRDSFFSYFGVEQVAITLPNDSMEVAETIKGMDFTEWKGVPVLIEWSLISKLMNCFPNSVVTSKVEFIAHIGSNTYFILKDCKTEMDVKCKVLEWLSRAAYKTEPYSNKKSNDKFHKFILQGINDFLGTTFSEKDMEKIYTYLGNRCNHEKTISFVASGYDMSVLEE